MIMQFPLLEHSSICYAGCLWEGCAGSKIMADICAYIQFVFAANEYASIAATTAMIRLPENKVNSATIAARMNKNIPLNMCPA